MLLGRLSYGKVSAKTFEVSREYRPSTTPSNDNMLRSHGTLLTLPQQSAHENRIYSVTMHCGESYPDEPPTIQFVSQVNLPCVNPHNGKVDPKQLPCLAQWKRENTMETVLIELRR